MAETLRKVKSYENKSLSNVIEFAAYISTLDVDDIDREFGYIIQTYEKTLKGDRYYDRASRTRPLLR